MFPEGEPFEGLGSMESWFNRNHAQLTVTHLYHHLSLPTAHDFDWLVIMGGGMSVNDEVSLPWLAPEKALVRPAIHSNKVVLGIPVFPTISPPPRPFNRRTPCSRTPNASTSLTNACPTCSAA